MKLNLKIPLLLACAAASACGKKSEQRLPQSGDAFPVIPLRLEEWCDRTDIAESAQKTVDALLKSLSAGNCTEFEASYGRLKPKRIVLTFEDLTDPAPITALTDLQELSVRGNKFTSLAWTAELSALETLDAAQNPLGETDSSLNMAALAPGLSSLVLDGTGIRFIEAAGEGGLTSLSLAGNDLSDASFLSGWVLLTELNIESNPLKDIAFLSDLTQLRTLRLSADQVYDLQGLKSNTGLRDLSIRNYAAHLTTADLWLPENIESLDVSVAGEGFPLFDMDMLKSMKRLRRLNASGRTLSGAGTVHATLQDLSAEGGKIAEIGVFSGLHGLTQLNVNRTALAALPDLSRLEKLTLLQADGNNLGYLDGSKLPMQLRTLHADGNRIASLRAGEKIPHLTSLTLKNNGISLLDAFDWPEELKTLDLSQNSIVQLQPLTGLASLTSLMLSRNLITNPAPLAELLMLEWLDLSHNKLDTIAPLAPLNKLGTLDVRSTGLPASVQCPVANAAACLF